MKGQAELIVRGANTLGEGIVWSPAHHEAQWTDIHGKAFWSFNPSTGAAKSIELPERLCCFAPLGGSRLLAGFASGLARYDLASGVRENIAAIEAGQATTRLNDGKVDRRGRLVFGTMDESKKAEPIARVWTYDGSRPRGLFDGVRISNSIAFSPDGRRMYFADTPQRLIWIFDYDIDSGDVSNRRVFVEVAADHGYPDGSTVDAEGCLWNAEWGGGRVTRYTPDGKVDRTIALPCSQITCCAFGGANLSTLFITSARGGLGEAKLAAEPEAGATFAIELDVSGLLDAPFRAAEA